VDIKTPLHDVKPRVIVDNIPWNSICKIVYFMTHQTLISSVEFKILQLKCLKRI
jgi:hypothetical protein